MSHRAEDVSGYLTIIYLGWKTKSALLLLASYGNGAPGAWLVVACHYQAAAALN